MVVPVRGHLDTVRRLLRGDFYVGLGCKQRDLQRSLYANDYKVAVERFTAKLSQDTEFQENLHTLSGKEIVVPLQANRIVPR